MARFSNMHVAVKIALADECSACTDFHVEKSHGQCLVCQHTPHAVYTLHTLATTLLILSTTHTYFSIIFYFFRKKIDQMLEPCYQIISACQQNEDFELLILMFNENSTVDSSIYRLQLLGRRVMTLMRKCITL